MHPRNAYSSDEEYRAAMRDEFAASVDIPWDEAKARVSYDASGVVPTDEIIEMRVLMRYMEADTMLKARGES